MDPLTKLGIKALLILLVPIASYQLGSHYGAKEVQDKWDLQEVGHKAVAEAVKQKNEVLSTENKRLSEENSKQLRYRQNEHDEAVLALQSEYRNRLRISEGRAGVYRQQAEGSSIERERLASHAAQLDQSLEEGRSLVRELRSTLGFREQQIEALSNQIRNDRKLLEN